MVVRIAAGLVLLLAGISPSSSSGSAYWASYSGFLQALVDEPFTNRTAVFSRPRAYIWRPALCRLSPPCVPLRQPPEPDLPFSGGLQLADVGTEGDGGSAPWFTSNANASTVGGLLQLSADVASPTPIGAGRATSRTR